MLVPIWEGSKLFEMLMAAALRELGARWLYLFVISIVE